MAARNWVERRQAREDNLRRSAPELWHELRSQIEGACKSFVRIYADDDKEIVCKLENGHRVRVTRTAPRRAEIIVSYDPATMRIESVPESGPPDVVLTIQAPEEGEPYLDHRGESYSPDEASELILERLLFP